MGIIKKMLRRNLTPEQLAERSRKEQEWAEKCYRAGERVGEKLNLAGIVNRTNQFINRYPKTFFTIVGVVLLVSMIGNFVWSRTATMDIISREAENLESLQVPTDEGRDILFNEVQKHTKRMEQLEKQLDVYMFKDTLTHKDSLAIRDIVVEMKAIHEALGFESSNKRTE